FSRAALSTISATLIAGGGAAVGANFTGATLRTSFPVRRSARTINVFWAGGLAADKSSAALAALKGEAAMASAVMKQIYTVLFAGALMAIATIFSCGALPTAAGPASFWRAGKVPAWAGIRRSCPGKDPR